MHKGEIAHTGRTHPTMKKIFGGVVILLAVVLLITATCGDNSKDSTTSTQDSYVAPVFIEKVGKEKNLYRFSDFQNNCVSVTLKSDAEFYPKGGKITIQNPNGEIWPDEPGTAHDRGNQPAGQYTVCKADSNAWGVEVWN